MTKTTFWYLAMVLLLSFALGEAATVSVSCVHPRADACSFTWTINPEVSAYAFYNNTTNHTTGFATLDVLAGKAAYESESQQMSAAFAAGFAEGVLTAAEIAQYFVNAYQAVFFETGPSKRLLRFVEQNDAYVREKAVNLSSSDDYWHEVRMVLARFDGLVAGYQEAASERGLRKLSSLELLWANLNDDLVDLQKAFEGKHKRLGHCSSFWKLTPGNQDLYFGHDTWDNFTLAAPRTWKHLTLPVRRSGALRTRTVSFSSSPGLIPSMDDYYVVNELAVGAGKSRKPALATSLAIVETTNEITNMKAYEALRETSVLYWIRVMVANSLAMTGPDWAAVYSREAAGTNNNQWQIGDMLLFRPGRVLEANTFLVLEEVPGLIHYEDQSSKLQADRYWPSFNVAYYPETRKIGGETDSYTEYPRARLFRQMQGNVTDDASMRWLMGWNNYKHDPVTKGDPENAIMARGDLLYNSSESDAEGGYDSKMSSWRHMAQGMTTYARAGPTNDDLPPFCWGVKYAHITREGHPFCFQFSWGAFSPRAPAGMGVESYLVSV